MNPLFNSVEYLKGLGPKRAKLLAEELSLKTFSDLLHHFPFRYEDRSKFYKINEIKNNFPYVQLLGSLSQLEVVGHNRSKRLVGRLVDQTGSIELVWFKGVSYLKSSLKAGADYVVFAKPNSYRGKINLVHPEMELKQDYQTKFQSNLQPVYPTTEKLNRSSLNSKVLARATAAMLPQLKGFIQENLPASIIQQYQLIAREQALFQIHYPKSAQELQKAIFRLKFEELFLIQLDLLKLKLVKTQKSKGFVFPTVGSFFNRFYEQSLTFELTNAQKRVMKEIRRDLKSGHQMNRLLQGDVGSGKTVVALMSMLLALDNGYQTAIMAPTEILAQQHFISLAEALKNLGVEFELLTGSTKVAKRRSIHERLESGSLQLLIGTHALIEEKVKFKNLGLAVIDEQHRFGVAQRAKLWKKNHWPPHVLIMTATPIPRTLAMTLYGDLDVSLIDELPPGRKEIKTIHWFENKRMRLHGFMAEEIEKGRQIYVVYPLIEESEKMDYANLEEGYQHIFNRFSPPKYKVSMLHGKMTADTKAFEMKRFVEGETDIMVSTTVIEVGVNVPNASVMVIESAERFGLSQLHQLRGRVGRGAEQSYCILMSGNKLSSDGRTRLKSMTATNDGFQIAEVDLKLRGPGDLRGTQQSGTPISLKLTNLAKDGELIEMARSAAKKILKEDPDLKENQNLLN